MSNNSTSAAAKPNPALNPLSILIGEWDALGKHPYFPGTVLRGKASFKWLEGGAFIIMRASIAHEQFPAGIAIFGSDGSSEEYDMIYFDEREVSRKYTATLKNNVFNWWRNDADFSQRFTCIISQDGNSIVSKGEMSKDGKAWEEDLELTYTRIL